MNMHFYSNQNMIYKNLSMGAGWKLLLQWKKICEKLGHTIKFGPSPREEEIRKYRLQYVDKEEPIPDRHRTILEINNKLIYFDFQDYSRIGAKLNQVPGLFDLCIKFQYRDGEYEKTPFKVVPFTYFTPNDFDVLLEHRKTRKRVLATRAFQHSILWAGNTGNTGLRVRAAINKYLIKNTKKSKHGRFGFKEYYQSICDSMVLASGRGIGDFCHRDMECMTIGTPFFRKSFNNRTHNPLKENVHYYTIGGDDVGIDKTMRHFCGFFEPDGELRQFSKEEWDKYQYIIENGINWTIENVQPKNSLKLLVQILEENGI